jgi:hypothetical protein
MSRIKRLTMAAIVTLALASATFAGNIHTGVVAPPPPPPGESLTVESQSVPTPGETTTDLTSSDLATEIILNLLQVLSVY